MASLAQLIVKITAESSDFQRGLNAAQKSTVSMVERLESAGSVLNRAVTLPLAALGAVALKQAADFDSLNRGLVAVTGSAQKAALQLDRLKEVAKLPGLGLKEAIQGSINLQAAGFSAQLAERSLKAFGNALATVGRGKADLDGVNRVLAQIANKPTLMAQDLNQLAERLPQIRQAMKAAFGTASTEEIQKLGLTSEQIITKIVEQFEKLPPVTGGLRNDFENLRDRAEVALAKMGNAVAPAVTAAINGLDPLIGKLGEVSEAFANLPQPIQTATIGLLGIGLAAGPILTVVANLGKLRVVLLRVASVISGSPILAKLLTGAGAVAGGAGLAAFFALDKLNEFGNKVDTGAEAMKRLNDRLRENSQAALASVGGLDRIGQLASSVFSDLSGKATVSQQALSAAFKDLGIKSTAELRKELEGAQAALSTIRQAVASGAASQQDLANATERVRAAQQALNGHVEQTRVLFDAIDFAAKSKENELFAASIAQISKESDRLRDELLELQKVASAQQALSSTTGTFLLEGPDLTGSIDGFARLIEGSAKYNDSLKSLEERTLRFTEALSKQAGAATRAADVAVDVQRSLEQSVRNTSPGDIAAFGDIAKPATKSVSEFGRQASLVLNDFAKGVDDAIRGAKSLGGVFADIGNQIASALIRNGVEKGVKALLGGLDQLIGKLGNVGDTLRKVFGGASSAASGAANAANNAAPNVSGILGSSLSGALGAVNAFSNAATAVFAGLQFFQGRRMEQDIGRIEVSNREIASQTISIQNSLNQWLPYLENTLALHGISERLQKIYEGLSQVSFGTGGGQQIIVQTANFNMPAGTTTQQMEAFARLLRSQERRFATA